MTAVAVDPFSLVIVVAAAPIASVLNPANAAAHCPHADMVSTTAGMLEVFAPQVVLYGLSVVLYGLLQAYRRFTGPALAPVPLVIATRRICGPAAVRGVGHAAMAGLAAGVVSAAVGVGVSLAAPASGKILAAGVAVVAAGCAVIVFGAVAYLLDRGDLKAVLGRLRRIVRSRS